MPGLLNYCFSPLYDTIVLPASTATGSLIRFFDVPYSGSKGLEKTNVKEKGKLTPGETFKVCSLRFLLIDTSTSDVNSLMKNFAVRLTVNGVTHLEGPLAYFNGGAGNTAAPNNGIADPRAVVVFGMDRDGGDLRIDIGNGMNFEVELIGTSFTTTATASLIQCILEGVYGRYGNR